MPDQNINQMGKTDTELWISQDLIVMNNTWQIKKHKSNGKNEYKVMDLFWI